jgi:hypothetical protein
VVNVYNITTSLVPASTFKIGKKERKESRAQKKERKK